MTQGQLPPIRGAQWRPKSPLEFVNSLPADAAKGELLRLQLKDTTGTYNLLEPYGTSFTEMKPHSQENNGMSSQTDLLTH